MKREILTYDDPPAVAAAVAEEWVALANGCAACGRDFCVALAGGSTPRLLYERLAGSDYRRRIDWTKVQLFFGDERTAPPTHEESNYHMAYEALIRHVPIPPEHVHRIPAERKDLDTVAREYAATLRGCLPADEYGFVVFDLVLLGIGEDGHVASLFPNTPALTEPQALAVAVDVQSLATRRVSITFPVINHAENVFIIATGARKAAVLREVLGGSSSIGTHLPISQVQPKGRLCWFIDHAAAADLGTDR